MLDPRESQGIVATYPYFQEIDSAANRQFRALWAQAYGADHDTITDSAATVWNGWHLWAAAVEKAGTTDREAVIAALESGISFEGPSGTVSIDPGSHHVIQNTHFGRVNDQHGFTVIGRQEAVPPAFEQSVCDVIRNPRVSRQFVPE